MTTSALDTAIATSRRRLGVWRERCLHFAVALCALTTLAVTGVLLIVLVGGTVNFCRQLWTEQGIVATELLREPVWAPSASAPRYGLLPLVTGTLLVTLGATALAAPVGIAAAIYAGEFATRRFRRFFGMMIQVLSSIPTVVLGFVALFFLSPLVQLIFPAADSTNALVASLAVAIMIVPTIVRISGSVLETVPQAMRYSAYALGSRPLDVTWRVTIPAAASGIFASVLIAVARAVGETMIVTMAAGTMAAGTMPGNDLNFLRSVQTLTAEMIQIATTQTSTDAVQYRVIFALGLTLFLTTYALNIVAHEILRRVELKNRRAL